MTHPKTEQFFVKIFVYTPYTLLEIGVRSGGVWKVGVTGTLKLSGRWN